MAHSLSHVRITAEPQANPNVCRFVIDRPLLEGASYCCSSAEEAQGSRLLESLYAVPGTLQVWIAGNILTLMKSEAGVWQETAPRIAAAIREQFASGGLFTPPARPQAKAAAEEGADDVSGIIRDLLETQVNPGVAGHGGKIELVEVRGLDVYLKMSGGCQGCSAAQVTLKQGVEKILRTRLPMIRQIIDVTDHARGDRPFFK